MLFGFEMTIGERERYKFGTADALVCAGRPSRVIGACDGWRAEPTGGSAADQGVCPTFRPACFEFRHVLFIAKRTDFYPLSDLSQIALGNPANDPEIAP